MMSSQVQYYDGQRMNNDYRPPNQQYRSQPNYSENHNSWNEQRGYSSQQNINQDGYQHQFPQQNAHERKQNNSYNQQDLNNQPLYNESSRSNDYNRYDDRSNMNQSWQRQNDEQSYAQGVQRQMEDVTLQDRYNSQDYPSDFQQSNPDYGSPTNRDQRPPPSRRPNHYMDSNRPSPPRQDYNDNSYDRDNFTRGNPPTQYHGPPHSSNTYNTPLSIQQTAAPKVLAKTTNNSGGVAVFGVVAKVDSSNPRSPPSTLNPPNQGYPPHGNLSNHASPTRTHPLTPIIEQPSPPSSPYRHGDQRSYYDNRDQQYSDRPNNRESYQNRSNHDRYPPPIQNKQRTDGYYDRSYPSGGGTDVQRDAYRDEHTDSSGYGSTLTDRSYDVPTRDARYDRDPGPRSPVSGSPSWEQRPSQPHQRRNEPEYQRNDWSSQSSNVNERNQPLSRSSHWTLQKPEPPQKYGQQPNYQRRNDQIAGVDDSQIKGVRDVKKMFEKPGANIPLPQASSSWGSNHYNNARPVPPRPRLASDGERQPYQPTQHHSPRQPQPSDYSRHNQQPFQQQPPQNQYQQPSQNQYQQPSQNQHQQPSKQLSPSHQEPPHRFDDRGYGAPQRPELPHYDPPPHHSQSMNNLNNLRPRVMTPPSVDDPRGRNSYSGDPPDDPMIVGVKFQKEPPQNIPPSRSYGPPILPPKPFASTRELRSGNEFEYHHNFDQRDHEHGRYIQSGQAPNNQHQETHHQLQERPVQYNQNTTSANQGYQQNNQFEPTRPSSDNRDFVPNVVARSYDKFNNEQQTQPSRNHAQPLRNEEPFRNQQQQPSRNQQQQPFRNQQQQPSRKQEPFRNQQQQPSRNQEPFRNQQQQPSRNQEPFRNQQQQPSRNQEPFRNQSQQSSGNQEPFRNQQQQPSRNQKQLRNQQQQPFRNQQQQFSGNQEPFKNQQQQPSRNQQQPQHRNQHEPTSTNQQGTEPSSESNYVPDVVSRSYNMYQQDMHAPQSEEEWPEPPTSINQPMSNQPSNRNSYSTDQHGNNQHQPAMMETPQQRGSPQDVDNRPHHQTRQPPTGRDSNRVFPQVPRHPFDPIDEDDSSEGIDVDAPTPPPTSHQPGWGQDHRKQESPSYKQGTRQSWSHGGPNSQDDQSNQLKPRPVPAGERYQKDYRYERQPGDGLNEDRHQSNQPTTNQQQSGYNQRPIAPQKPMRNSMRNVDRLSDEQEESDPVAKHDWGSDERHPLNHDYSKQRVRVGKSGRMIQRKPPSRASSSTTLLADENSNPDNYEINVTSNDLVQNRRSPITVQQPKVTRHEPTKEKTEQTKIQNPKKTPQDEATQTPSQELSNRKKESKLVFKMPDENLLKQKKPYPLPDVQEPANQERKRPPTYTGFGNTAKPKSSLGSDLLDQFKSARESALRTAAKKQDRALKSVQAITRMSKRSPSPVKSPTRPVKESRADKNADIVKKIAKRDDNKDIYQRSKPKTHQSRDSPDDTRTSVRSSNRHDSGSGSDRHDGRRGRDDDRRDRGRSRARSRERGVSPDRRGRSRSRERYISPETRGRDRSRDRDLDRQDRARKSERDRYHLQVSPYRHDDPSHSRSPYHRSGPSHHRGDEPEWVEQFRKKRAHDEPNTQHRAWTKDPRWRQRKEFDIDEYERDVRKATSYNSDFEQPQRKQMFPSKLMAKGNPPRRPQANNDDWMRNLKEHNRRANRNR